MILLLIGLLILIDLSTMHRDSFIKRLPRTATTRYIHTPATIHDDGSGLVVRWLMEPGYQSEQDFVGSVGVSGFLLHNTEGLWHASSRSGVILPWPDLHGYTEQELATAIHESAMRSQSEGATFLRQRYPEAMALLSQGKLHDIQPLPMGYVRNAIFFGLILALVACAISGRADLWAKRISIAIGPPTRDPNACPRCGYDAVGLNVCPECGTKLDQ